MKPALRHSDSRPVRQYSQSPQVAIRYGITRSPTCQPSTPSPSSEIRPTTSTPGMNGSSTAKRETPSRMSTSRWLSAEAATSITTSPGPGRGSGDILEPEHVKPAELMEHHCLHAATSRFETKRRLCLTSGEMSRSNAFDRIRMSDI